MNDAVFAGLHVTSAIFSPALLAITVPAHLLMILLLSTRVRLSVTRRS